MMGLILIPWGMIGRQLIIVLAQRKCSNRLHVTLLKIQKTAVIRVVIADCVPVIILKQY